MTAPMRIVGVFKREIMTTKKPINETTSKRVASLASKQLRNPNSTPAQKSVAGTALTQVAPKKPAKK